MKTVVRMRKFKVDITEDLIEFNQIIFLWIIIDKFKRNILSYAFIYH